MYNSYRFCPVCGFDNYGKVLEDFDICPCCCTQFSYNDSGPEHPSIYHDILRKEWIKDGMKFWAENLELHGLPDNYNPVKQLLNIGYIYSSE